MHINDNWRIEVNKEEKNQNTANTINAYFEAFAQGNIEKAVDLLTDDVFWHVDGDPAVFSIGLMSGKTQVGKWMKKFPKEFRPIAFNIKHTFIDGNEAVVLGDFRYAVIKTGHFISSDIAIHLTVQESKIARYHIFEDSLLLSRAFNNHEDATKKVIKLNGTQYAYSDRGNGPVLIFAHGLFADRSMFEAQVTELEKNYRCIILDLPAHGYSDYNKKGWTLTDAAQDIALFIKEMHIEPVCFVGHSQGGMIGIILAALYPHLISDLVLISTSARPEYSERIERWENTKDIIKGGSFSEKEVLFTRLQEFINTPQWLNTHREAAELERKLMHHCDETGLCLAIDAATINRGDIRHYLPQIKAHTLVMCGEQDEATPIVLSEEMTNLIPDAHLIRIKDTAHHPSLEAPEEVLQHIKIFLNESSFQ